MYNAFSQSLMKKYGWAPGEGLGKTNQGITQPIKATLKFDSYGLAYKEIDTNLESKWSTMFSSSASKLEVTENNIINFVKTNSQEENLNLSGVNSLYTSFIKSNTLMKDGVEVNVKKREKVNKRKRNENEITYESKIKRKKKNNYSIETSENDKIINEISDNNAERSKKKKNKKEIIDNKITCEDLPKREKRKKKSKSNIIDISEAIDTEIKNEQKKNKDETVEKKVKEKKRKKDLAEKQILVVQESTSLTCHLSARSGITMSGKLARIQKLHEQELLRSLSMKSVN